MRCEEISCQRLDLELIYSANFIQLNCFAVHSKRSFLTNALMDGRIIEMHVMGFVQ